MHGREEVNSIDEGKAPLQIDEGTLKDPPPTSMHSEHSHTHLTSVDDVALSTPSFFTTPTPLLVTTSDPASHTVPLPMHVHNTDGKYSTDLIRCKNVLGVVV